VRVYYILSRVWGFVNGKNRWTRGFQIFLKETLCRWGFLRTVQSFHLRESSSPRVLGLSILKVDGTTILRNTGNHKSGDSVTSKNTWILCSTAVGTMCLESNELSEIGMRNCVWCNQPHAASIWRAPVRNSGFMTGEFKVGKIYTSSSKKQNNNEPLVPPLPPPPPTTAIIEPPVRITSISRFLRSIGLNFRPRGKVVLWA